MSSEEHTASGMTALNFRQLPPGQLQQKLMAFAHQIAEASACLDWLRNPDSPAEARFEAQMEAPLHVQRLEKIVHELAGNQVDEIYAPDDSEDLVERLRRLM
jgi:hypothetical protein